MANAESGSSGSPDQQDESRLRASDDERHRVVELLGDHASAGRITLGELEERVGQAYAATTRGELATLTTDLPMLARDRGGASPEVPAPAGKIAQRFVAVLGGSTHRGPMRVSGTVNVVAVLGGDDIDLREAQIEGDELVVEVFSFLGGPTIYLPDTVDVQISGMPILGGNDERGSRRPARPGAPVVRINSFAILGGATVWRLPAETRGKSLKQARRAAKALERGDD